MSEMQYMCVFFLYFSKSNVSLVGLVVTNAQNNSKFSFYLYLAPCLSWRVGHNFGYIQTVHLQSRLGQKILHKKRPASRVPRLSQAVASKLPPKVRH